MAGEVDFSKRAIYVQGQLVPVRTGKNSDFEITKNISQEMDRISSLIAWWGSVKGAAVQELELADAVYRKWRASKAIAVLENDPKLAEWKVKNLIEADEDFVKMKDAVGRAKENVEIATVMVRAAEKKANVLQSRGANLRAEKGTQGMTTPEEEDDDEPSGGSRFGLEDDDDLPESYGGKAKSEGSPEPVEDKIKKMKEQNLAAREARKAEAAAAKAKAKKANKDEDDEDDDEEEEPPPPKKKKGKKKKGKRTKRAFEA